MGLLVYWEDAGSHVLTRYDNSINHLRGDISSIGCVDVQFVTVDGHFESIDSGAANDIDRGPAILGINRDDLSQALGWSTFIKGLGRQGTEVVWVRSQYKWNWWKTSVQC